MTTEQTADEDHIIQLKAPEQLLKGTGVIVLSTAVSKGLRMNFEPQE